MEICRDRLAESPDWSYVGNFNLSAYYRPHESQFVKEPRTPVPSVRGGYLAQRGLDLEKPNEGGVLLASWHFLFDKDAVCMNGSGRILDGRVISCDPKTGRFDWSSAGLHRAFKTVAMFTGSTRFWEGETLYIPELVRFLGKWDPSFRDGTLQVTDVGGGLASGGTETLDLFTGEGEGGLAAYKDLMDCTTEFPESGWWKRHPGVCSIRPPIRQYVDVYRFTH